MRASGRGCGFKSFMLLPRFPELYLVRHNLRLAKHCVKSVTTRSCGRRTGEHNIKRKYSRFQSVTGRVRFPSRRPFPRPIRRLSASFRQVIHRVFHTLLTPISRGYPRIFHNFYAYFSYALSTTSASTFSSAFSCSFRTSEADPTGHEKGVKQAEIRILRKTGFRWQDTTSGGGSGGCAHKMWHVEQSEGLSVALAAVPSCQQRTVSRGDAEKRRRR
jgi:hypothetical protein